MRKTLLFLSFLSIVIGSRAAIVPVAGTKYYILQASTLSGKVIGTTQYNEVALNDVANLSSQLFEFIPVAGTQPQAPSGFIHNEIPMHCNRRIHRQAIKKKCVETGRTGKTTRIYG